MRSVKIGRIAAGAIAAMAGTASAAPLPTPELPQVDAVGKVSELGESADRLLAGAREVDAVLADTPA